MAKRSIEYNKLENKIEIINSNILDLDLKAGSFDAIVCNPPYKKKGSGIINENDSKQISRHEITASLDDFVKVASNLLNSKGSIYMVNRPERLADIFESFRKYKIEPKNLRMVHTNKDEAPKLVLVKGTKCANPFLQIEKPLYIYNDDQNYTEEILKIYGKI